MISNDMKVEVWQVVKSTVGRVVDRIHLVTYVFQDETNWDDTPLQLSFTDSSVILLHAASDGEALHASSIAWADRFAEKQDKINDEFIQTHGRWLLRDMSSAKTFSSLIGASIDSTYPIFNRFGILNGVAFRVAKQCLDFVVEWDECHILWGSDNSTLLERGNVVGSDVLERIPIECTHQLRPRLQNPLQNRAFCLVRASKLVYMRSETVLVQ
jgi:hypothetical protein